MILQNLRRMINSFPAPVTFCICSQWKSVFHYELWYRYQKKPEIKFYTILSKITQTCLVPEPRPTQINLGLKGVVVVLPHGHGTLGNRAGEPWKLGFPIEGCQSRSAIEIGSARRSVCFTVHTSHYTLVYFLRPRWEPLSSRASSGT